MLSKMPDDFLFVVKGHRNLTHGRGQAKETFAKFRETLKPFRAEENLGGGSTGHSALSYSVLAFQLFTAHHEFDADAGLLHWLMFMPSRKDVYVRAALMMAGSLEGAPCDAFGAKGS